MTCLGVGLELGHICTILEEVNFQGGITEQPAMVDQTGRTSLREYPTRCSVYPLAHQQLGP